MNSNHLHYFLSFLPSFFHTIFSRISTQINMIPFTSVVNWQQKQLKKITQHQMNHLQKHSPDAAQRKKVSLELMTHQRISGSCFWLLYKKMLLQNGPKLKRKNAHFTFALSVNRYEVRKINSRSSRSLFCSINRRCLFQTML